MRFPYIHKVVREVATPNGRIIGTAAIQRHMDDKLRFEVFFVEKRPKERPVDIAAPRYDLYRGLEDIAKLAPLREAALETGAVPTCKTVLRAALNESPMSGTRLVKVAKFLRISTGVLEHLYAEYAEQRADCNGDRHNLIELFLERLAPYWKTQADMAAAFIRGESMDLTNYPVFVKISPFNWNHKLPELRK